MTLVEKDDRVEKDTRPLKELAALVASEESPREDIEPAVAEDGFQYGFRALDEYETDKVDVIATYLKGVARCTRWRRLGPLFEHFRTLL